MRVSRKGMKRGVKQTRVVLKPVTRGKNARGTCAHKRTKGAKVVTPAEMLQTGYEPREVTAYKMDLAKVRGNLR
jgi:hypothetical protein